MKPNKNCGQEGTAQHSKHKHHKIPVCNTNLSTRYKYTYTDSNVLCVE